MTRFRIIFLVLLTVFFLSGCSAVQHLVGDPLTAEDIENLQEVEDQMLQGYSPEVEIDRRIAEAVKQMVATLKPAYKRERMGEYKIGFLEISDIDRQSVTRFHNYVTEKTLTFSYLQPVIAKNFNIVERFLLKDVLRELEIDRLADPTTIDQQLAKELGERYGLDLIQTGVAATSSDFVDINLRLIETRQGQIVAVGSNKIKMTPIVRKWLNEEGYVEIGYPFR